MPAFTLAFLLSACNPASTTGDCPEGTCGSTGAPPTWEPGCILVDGGGGFAWLADALAQAADGAVVTLCEGEMQESVVVTRPVTLEGPGPDLLTWRGAPNEVALTVEGAAGVVVRGVRLASDRTAVEVVDAQDVRFENVVFAEVGATGLRATDTVGLEVADATFDAPGYGAVEVVGGEATVERVEVADTVGFGIRVTDGAEITVADSQLARITYSDVDTDGTVDDGRGLWVTDGAVLHTSGNTLEDVSWGISSYEGGHLDLHGDVVRGGLVGIEAWGGALDVEGVEVRDPVYFGIYAVPFATDVSLRDVAVSGDPDLVYNPTEEELVEGDILSTGIVVAGDAGAAFTGVTVEGYNAYGVLLTGTTSPIALAATLDDVAIRDSGLVGLYAPEVDATLTDVEVTGVRLGAAPWLDDTGTSIYVPGGFGASLGGSTVTWTGGSLSGNALAGAWVPTGSATFESVTIESNGWAGLVGLSASLVVRSSTFRHSSGEWDDGVYGGLVLSGGGIYSQDGSLLEVTSCTFEDNLEPDVDPMDDGGTRVYELASRDVFSYYDAQVLVADNTFRDGSTGLALYAPGDAAIERNAWTRYNDEAVYVSGSASQVRLADNTFEEMGGRSVYVYDAPVSLSGDRFGATTGTRYAYAEYDPHGKLTYELELEWDDESIYAYLGEIDLEDVVFEDLRDGAIYLYDSALIASDLAIRRVGSAMYTGQGAIDGTWASEPVEAILDGVEISGVASGDGISLQGPSSADTSALALADVQVSDVAGDGIVVEQVDGGDLVAVTVQGAGGAGVRLVDAALQVAGLAALDGGEDGLWIDTTDDRPVEVNGAEAARNAGNGIRFEQGTLGLSGVLATDNAGYGMSCGAPTSFSTCAGNVFTPNALGSTDRCDCTE